MLEHVKDKSKLLDTAEQFHIHADVIEEIGFAKVTGEKQKLAPFTKKLAEKVGADVIEKPIANTAVNETESVISGSPAWGLDGILELKNIYGSAQSRRIPIARIKSKEGIRTSKLP